MKFKARKWSRETITGAQRSTQVNVSIAICTVSGKLICTSVFNIPVQWNQEIGTIDINSSFLYSLFHLFVREELISGEKQGQKP